MALVDVAPQNSNVYLAIPVFSMLEMTGTVVM